MSIRRASARTSVNAGFNAARVATTNAITIAPATATTVAGGGTLGGVTISNVAITDSTFANVLSGDTAIGSAGGFVRITGSGFQSNAGVFFNNVRVANTFVSSTQINASIPATTAGTYNFYVFNTDGSGANFASGLITSGFPAVTATSYSLEPTANQLISATGDAPLSFSIQPGSSNPGNFTVNTAGYISGTGLVGGTYTLTVIVDDAQNQSTQADLTITVLSAEPYFNLTTLLLSGDGTNNANNQAFIDSSINNFAIARNGNATQGTFSPFSQTGWSVYLNGSSSFNAPAGLQTAFAGWGGRTRSWESFIFRSDSTNYTLASAYAGVAQNGRWYIYIGSNKLVFGWTTSPSTQTEVASTADIPLGWSHLTVCVNSTTSSNTTIYLGINGVIQTLTNNNLSTQTSSFGWNGIFSTGQFLPSVFAGYFASYRWSDNIRYSSNYTVPTAPFANDANTLFLLGQLNRFVDQSSNIYAITVSAGTPTIQAFSPFAPSISYNAATVGGSGYFDGTGDYLTSVTGASGSPGTGDFCAEAWIYPTSSGTINIFGNLLNIGGGDTQWGILMNTGSNFIRFQGWNTVYVTGAAPPLNAWAHVAVCRSGTNLSIFLNGARLQTATNSSNFSSTNDIRVGTEAAGNSPFVGYISVVRFVKGSSVYDPTQTTITIPTAPLTAIANTQFLCNFTNAGIIDATAKNVFETVGDARISTVQSKFGGSSMLFNGTSDYLVVPPTPNLLIGTGDFTLEAWVNATNFSTARALFSFANNNVFYFNTSGVPTYGIFGVSDTAFGSTALSTLTWTHVAFVRSGSTIACFLNGTSTGTVSSSASIGSATVVNYVGFHRTGNYWNGYIDDLRITRGFARYTANFTAPTSAFRLR